MNNKWDRRFMKVATLVSTWSKDPSSQIGAVLVDENRHIVATGYNGFPPGIADDERLYDRPRKYPLIVHAEMNALLQAGLRARGCTLYLHGFIGCCPCTNCTKHIITAGIKRIVYWDGTVEKSHWQNDLDAALLNLQEAGIQISSIARG